MEWVKYMSEQGARERITLVALDLFGRLGEDRVSMRAIATAAGCTVGLVQHHFGSKDGLRIAVEEEIIKQFTSALSVGPGDRASRDARVHTMLAEHPEIVGYLRRALLDRPDSLTRTGDASGILARLVAMSRDQVQTMRESGHARTTASEEDQVLRMLIRQFGVLFLEPMVAAVWGELNQPEITRPELTVTLVQNQGSH
jgi:AcrR family transcriptional regulator